jgi:hypothetical protein
MIYPDCEMRRWEYCDNTVVLANADNYYTKKQVEDLIDDVSGMTPAEVQEQIDDSIRTKADKSQVNEIAEQVRANTEAILNRYTKEETNSLLQSYLTKLEANRMVANYTKVQNTTLVLNSENIEII